MDIIARPVVRAVMTVIQICAKYSLLEVAQYEPVASVISVTTKRMNWMTGNWKTQRAVFCLSLASQEMN